MNLKPSDWNVVVAGHWNPAILTPAGIRKRLFELPEGTPLIIEVPLDGLAPARVKHGGLTVVVDTRQLVVAVDEPTYDNLEHAREIGARAMERLPETPLMAAGFNLCFKADEPADELLNATKAGVDNLLSDAAFEIQSSQLRRSIKWKDGTLNLTIRQEGELRIDLNFHRSSSKKEDLITWLRHPMGEVGGIVSRLFDQFEKSPRGGSGK